jgi:MFS family permease
MSRRTRLTVLLLVSTLPVMTGAVLSPALPALKSAFGGSASAQTWARWVLTTPALFVAAGAPLAGLLIDWKGRRPVLLASLVLFGASGSIGGLLGSLPAITVSRAALGLAAGGIGTAATTLIVDYFDEAQSQILGGQAAVMALAAMAYTILGGALTDLSWRAPFGAFALALVLTGPAFYLLPEPEPSSTADGPLDDASETAPMPWGRIGLLYGLAFLGLAVFNLIRVELPYYLRGLGLTSGLWIGAVLSAGTVTGALASFGYDRVRARVGAWGTLAVAFGLFAAGFGVIARAISPGVVLGGLLLAGGGMGLFVPSLTDGVGETVPENVRGRALGGLSTLRNLGRFAAPLLTRPALVGPSAAAPFLGGTVLASILASGLLLWTLVQYVQDHSATAPEHSPLSENIAEPPCGQRWRLRKLCSLKITGLRVEPQASSGGSPEDLLSDTTRSIRCR